MKALIGALRVTLGLDSAQFTSGLTAAQQQLRQSSNHLKKVGDQMAGVGAAMTVAITAPIIAAGFHLLKGSQDAAAAAAQVNAALNSMGDASGKTFDELQRTAEGLRNLTGVDDDDILKKVTANLLTFGNVSGGVFDRAQASILDISARLGTDLQSATMMVGKALNDPIRGLGALRKTGIQFTEQQQDQIKAMTAAGDAAGAQAIMLSELERQFGGAAEAAANADIWTPMRTALMDLEGAFEPLIRNVVTPAIKFVADLARSFADLPPSMIGVVAVAAAVAAALGPILVGAGLVVSAIGSIGAALATGGMLAGLAGFAVAAAPFVAAAAAIGAAIYLFRDDLAPILSDFGKQIHDAIGPAIPPLMDAARTAFAALGDTMSALMGVLGPILGEMTKHFGATFGPGIVAVLRVLAAAFTTTFNMIGQALRIVSAILTGDWAGAWNAAGSLVMETVRGLGRIIEAVFPGILGNVRRMVEGVREWFGAKLTGIFDGVISRVQGVSDAFFRMYDAVVGHSYVPDMVEGVGHWMAKLQGLMVDPAVKGTRTAAEAFEEMSDRARAAMANLLTDRERLALDFTQQMKDLEGIQDPAARAEFQRRATLEHARASAGIDGENLTIAPIPTVTAANDLPEIKRLNEAMDRMRETIAQSREDFADAFSYGIEAAMNGDWASVLQTIVTQVFGGTLQDSLRKLGGSLFDKIGGGSGGGFDFGSIGKTIGSLFGKIPGFATGGSFKVGGAGGIDSKLISMRLTPGEMVDVRRPDQLMAANSNTPMHFDLRGAVMTADLLAQMQGMASQSGGNALRTARVAVPADQAKSSRYSLGGRR